jgi:sulfur carrier protein
MQIILNGKPGNYLNINTVEDLLKQLQINGHLAVEINQQIIPRSKFKTYKINSGDVIEVVHAIGGG